MATIQKNNITDEILIKQFQNGDRQSYNELVFRYKDKILNFLYKYKSTNHVIDSNTSN